MTINTKHFGALEVDAANVFKFETPLPAFEHLREYAVVTGPGDDPDGYFHWLQSTEDESVAFVIIDMTKYNPEYNPLVNQDELKDLGEYNPETFVIFNIAVIPEDVKESTVNLKAPVVLNRSSGKGKQTICTNEEYTVRHYLFR